MLMDSDGWSEESWLMITHSPVYWARIRDLRSWLRGIDVSTRDHEHDAVRAYLWRRGGDYRWDW